MARLYLKGVALRDLWDDFRKQHPSLSDVLKPEFVLKVITLLEGKETKKASLLDIIDALDQSKFERQWSVAARFTAEAYNRMTEPLGGYGAFENGWIPYTTLIVPLAALLWKISESKGGEEMYRKVDRWYWASVFTQRYDQAVDSTTYRDVKDVTEWLAGKEPPGWITTLASEIVDFDVDEPRSALYRGLMCLVVLSGAKDFINGQAANLKECQDDHIFPRSKFGKHPKVNTILNRTLISSNPIKSDKKPSEYLPLFLKNHGNDKNRLGETLQSHLIDEDAWAAMEKDDFDMFLEARKKRFTSEVKRRIEVLT